MREVLVNTATWAAEEHPEIPSGWPVVNAPRPLRGQVTWTGPFRHGVFYAASPVPEEGLFGWEADDAWPVTLITNEEITARVNAKLARHGFASAEEADCTVAELAASYDLPWAEAREGAR